MHTHSPTQMNTKPGYVYNGTVELHLALLRSYGARARQRARASAVSVP
jgi:hypothetical protein